MTQTAIPATQTHQTAPSSASATQILRSRWTARLLSPVVAVLPWWVTLIGVAGLYEWRNSFNGGPGFSLVLGPTLWLLLGALLWGAVTAWSSVGTLLAGGWTVLTGLGLSTRAGQIWLGRVTLSRDVDFMMTADWLGRPFFALVIGSLLLAMGLATAVVRHLPR